MASPSSSRDAAESCPGCGFTPEPGAGPLNFCPSCGQDLRSGAADRTQGNVLLDQVIADRYRLIALVGEGGMGSVYKAEHIRMGKALAVKILRGDFASEPGAVARFRSEAQIVSRLSHPHTIAVFDFGEIEELGGFYLAMEYVPGKDLAQVLREEGRFSEARAAEIGQQILGSLAEAHEAGVVHRDMKPANVMLMQARPGEDFAKVLDFGIAKLRDEGAAASTTSAGAIVGTPNYLAPEQARGEEVDARADLYAVGCVLHELVSGRPPFVAPTPMAIVSAHLHDPPPSLVEVAPGTSPQFAEVVARALAKRPADRFASADEMRRALLALDEVTGARRVHRRASEAPEVTGKLEIARREDFRDFERQLRALRRRRIGAPIAAVLLLAAAAAGIWRWPDLYALAAARVPRLAALVPPSLRPSDRYDGVEHEPNDVPAQANVLPLPPGKDGRAGGGVATVKGYIGAKLNETTGDVDVYRIEVPPFEGREVLVAEWHGEKAGEGIRGLDVALALNRVRAAGDARTSAPLVASVDHGGPGEPETLVAAVQPGTYYLTVRERHDAASAPVEKPTDPYLLEVRLAEPQAGEEIEPNDEPELVGSREERYPEWRSLAERNPLAEGRPVHGETSPRDPDTFAVVWRGPGEVPRAVAVVPDAGLALTARLWVPDAADLEPPGHADRVRFQPAGEGGPGEVLWVDLPTPPREGAPVLLQLRGLVGEGGYSALALGEGSASGAAAQELVRALADGGRLPAALELAAGFARHVTGSPARAEVLLLAGGLAARAAPAPETLPAFARADRLLGAPVYEADGGVLRYRAAFEAEVKGTDRLAEEAALRVVRYAAPCTPAAVAGRVEGFAERYPRSAALPTVRLWRARALEEALWASGGRDARLRGEARAAWERVAQGPAADEAREALGRLRAHVPPSGAAAHVCPDPGQ
ncbi:MAG TPA: serine/threonine-protein kinase [Anaeromyxobacter sp.]|nr:serine/threonine-protein kinase [Anaeromyxobacter sp.]